MAAQISSMFLATVGGAAVVSEVGRSVVWASVGAGVGSEVAGASVGAGVGMPVQPSPSAR